MELTSHKSTCAYMPLQIKIQIKTYKEKLSKLRLSAFHWRLLPAYALIWKGCITAENVLCTSPVYSLIGPTAVTLWHYTTYSKSKWKYNTIVQTIIPNPGHLNSVIKAIQVTNCIKITFSGSLPVLSSHYYLRNTPSTFLKEQHSSSPAQSIWAHLKEESKFHSLKAVP